MFLLLLAVLGMIILYRWHRQSQILENVTDKYVFITGCDSGFGNLLAKQLDRRGMKVLAACLTQTGAENLKKETSSRLKTTILDVTDTTSVSSAVKWVSATVGNAGLWGLVNNAGIITAAFPNEWQTREDFFRDLNVNFLGAVDVTVQLLHLVRKAQGRVVNVSSAAGRIAVVGGGYCPSKSAVEAFSDSLRRDMHGFGVKVSIVEPGVFQTQMTLTLDPYVKNQTSHWDKLPPKIKEDYGEDYFKQYIKVLRLIMGMASPKINKVPDCMEHALTAVHPWTRYSPGWDSKLFFIPLSYLPTFISDYFSDYIHYLFAPKRVQTPA
ncbi:retinol dehydrogenase 7-like [Hyperolius riggenbachi]|uniref:retinol dehydrogenase 7-like n=1 Tax=Hyperolius riggenbachi TaxID=752182 RepID=UPI0035A3B6A9